LINIKEIIKYKKDNMDSVELLLWNHDVQYFNEECRCSWYRPSMASVLETLFTENEKLFKIFHQEGNYLFSHAGITKQWLKYNQNSIDNWFCDWYFEYPQLNIIMDTHNKDIFFQCGSERGGAHLVSWPLWADKRDTEVNWIEWIIQVVGHTKVAKITKKENIIYCDNLEYGNWIPLIITI